MADAAWIRAALAAVPALVFLVLAHLPLARGGLERGPPVGAKASSGGLVARRVLQPAELGVTQPVLQAGQELPISALLSTGDRRVEGYTLELFYP